MNGAATSWSVDPALLILVGVGLFVVIALLFAVLLMSRRRFASDARDVVRAIEELRAGDVPDALPRDPGSPLALVFDALQRLGQDVGARVRTTEENDSRARRTMEALEDVALVTTDVDGDIRNVSRGAEMLFGWDENELLGQPASMLFDEHEYKQFLPKLARRTLREQGVRSNVRLKRRDGRDFPAELLVRQISDGRQGATGFLIRVRDVEERVTLERRAEAAEARYDKLVRSLSVGVATLRGGRIQFANEPFATMCGLDFEDSAQAMLRDRLATSDLLHVEEAIKLVEADGRRRQLSCRTVDERGLPLTEMSLDLSRLEDEEDPSVFVVAHDRSEQLRVEEELRRNEARLDSVIEAASDGILLLSSAHQGSRVQLVNAAFAEQFEATVDELLGLTAPELERWLNESGPLGERLATFLGTQEGAAKKSFELTGATRVVVDVELLPLETSDSDAPSWLLVCRDQSAQRETEHELQIHAEQLQLSKVMLEQAYRRLEDANRELQGRSDQLRVVNEELQRLDEMRSNLIGNVSHELQTPLVSIRGYTEMTLRERLGPITDEQRKGLDLCLKNVDRLISMIDNLLVLARSQPEAGRLKLTHFDLRPLIAEAADLLREKIVAREIRFAVQIEGNDLRLHADRDKVLQVMINLLSNAIKFNRQNGRVRVNAKLSRAGFAEIQVEDSGVGIPEDELARVLDRHYQVADSGRSSEGSGIGLAIVKEILESHGCKIDVTSRLGEGSRFRFDLPLSPQQPASATRDSRVASSVGTLPDDEPLPPQAELSVSTDDDASIDALLDESFSEAPADDEVIDLDAAGEAEPPRRFRIIRPQEPGR